MKNNLRKLLVSLFVVSMAAGLSARNIETRKAEAVRVLEPIEYGGGGGGTSSSAPSTSQIRSVYNSMNDYAKYNVTFETFRDYALSHSLSLQGVKQHYESLYPDNPYNPYSDSKGNWWEGGYWWRTSSDVDGVISSNHYWNDDNKSLKEKGNGWFPQPFYKPSDKIREIHETKRVDFDLESGHNSRTPTRSRYLWNIRYDDLKVGDIFWDSAPGSDFNPSNIVSHVGIITNLNQKGKLGGSNFDYVETIEAVASGVRFGFIDDTRVISSGVRILRPNCSDSIKQSAVNFMYSQLGKKYDIINRILGANTEGWYCTDLAYYAYRQAGFDLLDSTTNSLVISSLRILADGLPSIETRMPITAAMLSDSSKTTEVNYYSEGDNGCPEITGETLVDYNTVRLTVKNPNSFGCCLSYTPTLYFLNDILGKYDKDDVELRSIYINGGQSKTIDIDSNWFAGTALMFFAYRGYYHVTVINGDILGSSSPRDRVYKFLEKMENDCVQCWKDDNGLYQFEIQTCSRVGDSEYIIPHGPLMTTNEAQNFNFSTSVYSSLNLLVTNPGNNSVSIPTTSTYNNYTNHNAYCYKDVTNDQVVWIELDKTAGSYTVHRERIHADYCRLTYLGMDGNFYVIRVINDSDYGTTYNYNTQSTHAIGALNRTFTGSVGCVFVSAHSYYDIYIYKRSESDCNWVCFYDNCIYNTTAGRINSDGSLDVYYR